MSEIACPACTYLNPSDRTRCDICETGLLVALKKAAAIKKKKRKKTTGGRDGATKKKKTSTKGTAAHKVEKELRKPRVIVQDIEELGDSCTDNQRHFHRHELNYHAWGNHEVGEFRRKLVQWYHQNRRKLPWRGDDPPYTQQESQAEKKKKKKMKMKMKMKKIQCKHEKKWNQNQKDNLPSQSAGTTRSVACFFGGSSSSPTETQQTKVEQSTPPSSTPQKMDISTDESKDTVFNNDQVCYGGDSLLDHSGGMQAEKKERKIDPYAVWVSEIMCQQTRIATVIGYHQRWMARFPTISALAQASLEDVNEIWAGLGYYRRARMLLQGAQMVNEQMKGVLPTTVKELLKIPGIGPYTAGAIASICFSRPAPLVDGNVIRVFSRVRAVAASTKDKKAIKLYWKMAEQLVDPAHPGDFNQGLMELGACVCTPKTPQCGDCPVRSLCKARKEVETKARPLISLDEHRRSNHTNSKTRNDHYDADDNNGNYSDSNASKGSGGDEQAQFDGKEYDSEATDDEEGGGDMVRRGVPPKNGDVGEACDICIDRLPQSVLDYPTPTLRSKPKDETVAVCVVKRVQSTHAHISTIPGLESKPTPVATGDDDGDDDDDDSEGGGISATPEKRGWEYLFFKRPETGLLANQWEFPSVMLSPSSPSSVSSSSSSPTSLPQTPVSKSKNMNTKKTKVKKGEESTRKKEIDRYLCQHFCFSLCESSSSSLPPPIPPASSPASPCVWKQALVSRGDLGEFTHVFSHRKHLMLVEQLTLDADKLPSIKVIANSCTGGTAATTTTRKHQWVYCTEKGESERRDRAEEEAGTTKKRTKGSTRGKAKAKRGAGWYHSELERLGLTTAQTKILALMTVSDGQ